MNVFDDLDDESVTTIQICNKPVPRIVLTRLESELYLKMKSYTRGTSDTPANNFWGTLRQRKSYKDWHNGSVFVLDPDFVKDNLDGEDRLFAQVMWNMLEPDDDDEAMLYLKMKWNF